MKTCPISNHPIDIIPHSRNAVQVTCPASRWTSSIFSNVDDAYEFRESLDIPKQIATARREQRGGMVRLVGNKWMTEFMTSEALDRLVAEAGSPSTGKRRGRSASKEKEKEPEVQNVETE